MKKLWTDKIRERMEDMELQSPESLLDSIKAEMARRDVHPQPRVSTKSRPLRLWLWSSAAAAVFLGCAWFFWNGHQSSTPSEPIAHRAQSGSSNQQLIAGQPTEDTPVKPMVPTTSIHQGYPLNHQTHKPMSDIMVSHAKETTPVIHEATDTEVEAKEAEEVAKEQKVEVKEQTRERKQPSADKQKTTVSSLPAMTTTDDILALADINENTHHWDIEAYYQGGPGFNSIQSGGRQLMASSNWLYDNQIEIRILNAKTTAQEEMRTRHKQPIKLGTSVRYHLNDRWSLQSGLTYSYHSSDITKGTETNTQNLHFIGIPLTVAYHVWGVGHFNCYLSAGGEAEKMVKGTLTTPNDKNPKTRLHSNELRWSATSSVGIEYSLANHFSIYAEPGVSYHFKNSSNIQTIYDEQPFNFSFNIGVRISFP